MLPPNSLFFLTDTVAEYLKQRFWWHITECMRQTPAPWSGKITLALPDIFSQDHAGPYPPYSLRPGLVNEIEHMASLAAQAYITRGNNLIAYQYIQCLIMYVTVVIDNFDAQRYENYLSKKPTGRTESDELKYRNRYPIRRRLSLKVPSTINDRFGRIMVWYLPEVLFESRQVMYSRC